MATLCLTFENGRNTLKIGGDLDSGWQNGEFHGRGSVDYLNDTQLRVNLDVHPPKKRRHLVTAFPKNVIPQRFGNDSLYYVLNACRLEVWIDLANNLDALPTSGKLGVLWRAAKPIATEIAELWVEMTAYIQPRSRAKRPTREFDLLPFLPGGQFESKKSHH